MGRVLVVDDDRAVTVTLRGLLEQAGHRTQGASNGQEALERVRREWFDCVLTDLRMPGLDGLQLVEALNAEAPQLPVVMLSAHGTVETAVEAMRRGAVDFLEKPFDREAVVAVVERALARGPESADPVGRPEEGGRAEPGGRPERSRRPELGRRPDLGGGPEPPSLLGASDAMRRVLRLVDRAASSRARVLIRGESGTGKELVARRIHERGPRASGPFVAVNCAALPETLIEAEMFGFEEGAFTHAVAARPGRIELASGGTLFLDEIGDLDLGVQAKLLRFLESATFERLGSGGRPLRSDARVVAATLRDLGAMVKAGTFRDDLYYRLAVLEIPVPPLRERAGDVELLARRFFSDIAREEGRSDLTLSDEAVQVLAELDWPGNVRQLRNFIERLVVFAEGQVIDAEEVRLQAGETADLGSSSRDDALGASPGGVQGAGPSDGSPPSGAPPPSAATADGASDSAAEHLSATRRSLLRWALAKANNNRTQAARLLGVSRRTIYRWIDEDPEID